MTDLELVTELVFMLAWDEPSGEVSEKRAMRLLKKHDAPILSSGRSSLWSNRELLQDWCFEVGILTHLDVEEGEEGTLPLDLEDGLDHVAELFYISTKPSEA